MALESGTFINSLVITNPEGTDLKSTLDDHVRLIKSTLLNTFPNITGAVTASAAEINYLSGLAGNVTTLLGEKLTKNATLIAKTSTVLAPLAITDISLTAVTGDRFYKYYAYTDGLDAVYQTSDIFELSAIYAYIVFKGGASTDLLRFDNRGSISYTVNYGVLKY